MNQLQPRQMQALWFQQVIGGVIALIMVGMMVADLIKAFREALGKGEEI